MADLVSFLPQILVYALLLFAAFILFRYVRKFMKGETGCIGCSADSACSGSACGSCCGPALKKDERKHDELETIKR
ncbi:MAG: hypothetical protein LBU81_00200 [Methanosarcinales archaeon]|jgi:hypothetical protein|nr:hypothetical protein [Methanosarcinales archaeon]